MTVVSSCQHACIQEVRNSYTMDAKATTQLQTLVVRSLEEEGYKLGRIKFHSGLWIGDNVVLKTMRIDELHASTVGIRATYIPLKKMFLSGKEIHVEEFVKQCVVCQWEVHGVSMGQARACTPSRYSAATASACAHLGQGHHGLHQGDLTLKWC